MHVPVRFGLVGSDGADIAAEPVAGAAEVEGDVIHLVTAEADVVFDGLSERPRLSILRDFSAPVTLRHEQSRQDRLALAQLDPNGFGRWRALTDLLGEDLRAAAVADRAASLDPQLIAVLVDCAAEEALEPALRAQMIAIPGESEIARLVGTKVDPEAVHRAREEAIRAIARSGSATFRGVRNGLARPGEAFSPDAASAGRRALSNALLMFLSAADDDPAPVFDAFLTADNMTDRMAAASILAHRFPQTSQTREALDRFYRAFEADPLVLDKWFTLQATVPVPETLDTVRALAAHPKFTLANPNRARALIGGFATGNQRVFHRADGGGYRWTAERLGELDRLNPQTAARLATAFRSWRSFEPGRQAQARAALSDLAARPDLSRDLRDILERTLT